MAGQPTLIYSAEFSFFLLLPDGKNISGAGVRPGLLLFLPPAPPTHTIGMVVVGRVDEKAGLYGLEIPLRTRSKNFVRFFCSTSYMGGSFVL